MCKKYKIIVIFGCLCFFMITCSGIHQVPRETISEWGGEKKNIVRLRKISGEVIKFLEIERGYIKNDTVVGLGIGSIKVDAKNVVKDIYDYGELKTIITKDKKEYEVIYRDENKDCYWIQDSEILPFNIFLSDVREIVILKRGKAVGMGVLGGVLIGGAIGGFAGLVGGSEEPQVLPIAGGMIGLPIGLIVGIMSKAEDTYIISSSPDSVKVEH